MKHFCQNALWSMHILHRRFCSPQKIRHYFHESILLINGPNNPQNNTFGLSGICGCKPGHSQLSKGKSKPGTSFSSVAELCNESLVLARTPDKDKGDEMCPNDWASSQWKAQEREFAQEELEAFTEREYRTNFVEHRFIPVCLGVLQFNCISMFRVSF